MLYQSPSNRIVRITRSVAGRLLRIICSPALVYRRQASRRGSNPQEDLKVTRSIDEETARAWLREVDAMERF